MTKKRQAKIANVAKQSFDEAMKDSIIYRRASQFGLGLKKIGEQLEPTIGARIPQLRNIDDAIKYVDIEDNKNKPMKDREILMRSVSTQQHQDLVRDIDSDASKYQKQLKAKGIF